MQDPRRGTARIDNLYEHLRAILLYPTSVPKQSRPTDLPAPPSRRPPDGPCRWKPGTVREGRPQGGCQGAQDREPPEFALRAPTRYAVYSFTHWENAGSSRDPACEFLRAITRAHLCPAVPSPRPPADPSEGRRAGASPQGVVRTAHRSQPPVVTLGAPNPRPAPPPPPDRPQGQSQK